MAIVIPKFSELYNSILADFKNKLGIINIVGKNSLNNFAAVYAAKLKLTYITISRVNDNIYPDTCDEVTLRRFGRIRLGRDIRAAISGEYTISVSGEDGATIAINTTFSNVNGFLFVLDSTYTFVGTTGTITVRALTACSESALTVGEQLQLTAPMVNVNTFATVDSVDVIPSAAETVEEYRVNVISSFTLLPQGGSRADYRSWTESVPGVREVYPYVKYGSSSEINLYVEAFVADSTDTHGTPTSAILLAVQDAIEPAKIPMTVQTIYYLPIIPQPIDVEITDLSDISKLLGIKSSIESYLYNKRPYIAGADIATDINKGYIYASVIEGIVINSGVTFTSVVCKRSGTPFTTTEFIDEKIPYINNVLSV